MKIIIKGIIGLILCGIIIYSPIAIPLLIYATIAKG